MFFDDVMTAIFFHGLRCVIEHIALRTNEKSFKAQRKWHRFGFRKGNKLLAGVPNRWGEILTHAEVSALKFAPI